MKGITDYQFKLFIQITLLLILIAACVYVFLTFYANIPLGIEIK